MRTGRTPAARIARRLRVAGANRLRLVTRGSRLLPDFLVIGAARAGTTSLYNYLVRHPDIAPAERKEIHYFDWHYDEGGAWYRSKFPLASARDRARRRGRERLTGEASANYLFSVDAPGRAAALVPGAKLIVLLRDPVDRAWSHYVLHRELGREPLTFEEAIERELSHPPARDEPGDPRTRERHTYLARGIYADQLEAWLRCFRRDQMLVRESERFFADPASVYEEVVAFLALPPAPLAAYEKFNVAGYPEELSPAMRGRLAEYFRPHNERLWQLLQTRFDWD